MENAAPGRVVETTWDQKNIKFQWERTEGIKHYTLIVRNVLDKTKEIIHKDFPESKCQHRKELKEELRIGQTCEIKLKIFCPNDVGKDSQWETCIIGGPKVPRNPTATVNLEKPTRSLHAQWMEPEIKPDSYEVECIPLPTGKRKTQISFKRNTTFNRLKTNTNYRILVRAVYADDSSRDSESNMVSTHAKPSDTMSTQYSNIHDSNILIENQTTLHHSQVTNVRKDDFDKPRNVEIKMSTDDGNIEMATVSWDPPGFSGESDDYEILQYDVKVLQESHTMFTKHLTDQSCTEKFLINLGKCYTVHIKTKYEEIDTEKIIEADFKTVFHSRPTEPNVRVKVEKEQVLVQWDSARGAERYELKIFESESKKEIDYQEIIKALTKHTKPIGEFFLGTYYTFQVTAHSKDNRCTTTKSINYLIGGGSIPRMAKAFLNKEKPTECVDLRWEAPEESIPSHYLIKEANRPDTIKEVNETRCTLYELKSGLSYQFSIIAVYNGGSESDGCLTNEVTTDPRPSCVQNLQIKLDDQYPDRVIVCKWDETPNATMYKIRAMSDGFLQEHVIKNLQFKFKNLTPDMEYTISVKAGNKSGYGKISQDKTKTEIWVPTHISLHADEDNSLVVDLNGTRHGLQNIVSLFEARNDVYVEENSTHGSSCKFDKVKNNTKYFVKVQTANGERKSRITKSKDILTRPEASVIKSLDLCSENQSTDINIEWKIQYGILYYEIEIQTNQEIENILKVANNKQCKYRCLQEGNEYSLRVRAANTSEFGEWSEISSILLAPPKIFGLNAEVTEDKIIVTWEELPSNIAYYLIQVFVGERLNEKVHEEKIDERKFEIFRPLPCTKHKFVVSAYNINDIQGQSASKEILTDLLHPPKSIKAILDESRPWAMFHLEWDRPESAKSFLILANDECIGNYIKKNKFTFCDTKPTQTYRIKLYSMCGFIKSEYTATTSITTGDVPEIDSDSIKVVLDDIKPWEKAIISWKMPLGVENVSVNIKSHHPQAGPHKEIKHEIRKKNLVEFVNPNDDGEEYLVEIYSMVEGHRQPLPTASTFRLGLMAPSNLKVSLDKDNPWGMFHLTWDWPKSAESFSVYVNSMMIGENIKDNKWQVDVKCAATKYYIKVLSFCGTIESKHPAEVTITTATINMVQADTVKWEPDSEKPWEKVLMRWDRPTQVERFKIIITSGGITSAPIATNENYYEITAGFKNVIADIYSGIGDVQSPTSTSVNYILADLPEIESKSIEVELDETEPRKIAKISWEMPVEIDFAVVDIQPHGYHPNFDSLGKHFERQKENFVTFKSDGVTSEYKVEIYAEVSGRRQRSPASTTFLMGRTAADVNKIIQRKYSSTSTHKKNMMPMISDDDGGCNISLVEFVEISTGQVNVIKGGHYSGKTTICDEIERTISSSETRVFHIQSEKKKKSKIL
ncbi:uncharacterized protein LOC144430688 [Styela clava]